MKRLTALFFILVLAGQVWAGVCGCFQGEANSHAKMSCCKRQKKIKSSVSPKKCCDTICGMSNGESKTPRMPAETDNKIPAPVLAAAVEKLIFSLNFHSNYVSKFKLKSHAFEIPLGRSHPPDLYLQNHAFLI